ncbi:flagellar hook-associated protein 1 FlgK [Desulfohalotomaculum tongense]|uniref:flagellar hook-associated protein FlgK n=1 Tax=Desulforadius tongensis TaxID=1216062 RepID=UPI001957562B|nr:flagellar hook-associated protein FlgK [Desulforadius tongensis]MBM7856055.1 flagellar hook-associated protein 1 FlgK [Desulforadius tongensis]
MPGTFFGIETARRGMNVHQNALDITGHNLANASTPGYSRQEAVITAADPYANPTLDSSVTPGQFGTGAEVTMIRRVRDEYLDNSVRNAATAHYYWEDQISVLQRAEACFAEPASAGIGQRIVDFFKSWMDLNNTPQDPGTKASVVQVGEELASLMSAAYKQLDDVEKSVAAVNSAVTPPQVTGGKLADQVNQVNDLLGQINNLNTAIVKIYAAGQQPNDLLDKRDRLLEELSGYGPVEVTFETANGKPTGEITELKFLGMDITSLNNKLELAVDNSSGGEEMVLEYGSETVNLTDSCYDSSRGGSLLGLERARQQLMGFKEKLNDIATSMRDKIAAVSSPPFFVGDLQSDDFGDFGVNSALVDSPELIDGTKAKDIANLRDEDIDPVTKPFTFEEYYSRLVTEVGGSVKAAGGIADSQLAISQQITALRDSVSGVAIDEELTRMIQFQYGFQASARMINTLDGMLDVIINRLF